MLFNSIDFAIFLPVVFALYWFVTNRSLKLQNFLIVAASFFFYGWWDWRFLSLLIFSIVVDYIIGRSLLNQEDGRKRKMILWISIVTNLGFLGFFKYYNFFVENFVEAFRLFGQELNPKTLNIILPVGISFYTFQTLSYTIDVYRRKLEPTKDIVAFAAFVSFFPQLVAGPIERATNLLPQFYKKRTFEYDKAVDGLRQMLWGLFKKMVIADNCAVYVNYVFENPQEYSGSTLFLGAVFFAFQIYCDFSGYSDIAIGSARLFGFRLMRNFAFPYFSRDIAEFWRRWHISLTTWFRDYVYIPLGGSRVSKSKIVRNTFIIFLVSGFWHGANWTFIVWGALHAFLFLPLILLDKNRKYTNTVAEDRFLPNFKEALQMLITFLLVLLGWIFFRAESISQAFEYIGGILNSSLFSIPFPDIDTQAYLKLLILLIIAFVIIEWIGRGNAYAVEKLGLNWKRAIRWSFYIFIILIIISFRGEQQQFIYFQF